MSFDLARLSDAVAMLAQTCSLEDVTRIHNIAQSAEDYAKAEKLGDEAERYAREIRLRAARKAGELLAEMAKNGERRAPGGDQRSDLVLGKDQVRTLADLNVDKKRSARWQRIAQVPEETFEKAVHELKGENAVAALASVPRTPRKAPVPKSPKSKINGFTEQQSLRGLRTIAIDLESLAVALEGNRLGEWARLFGVEEAQRFFVILERSLPVINARIKRALKDWKEYAA